MLHATVYTLKKKLQQIHLYLYIFFATKTINIAIAHPVLFLCMKY